VTGPTPQTSGSGYTSIFYSCVGGVATLNAYTTDDCSGPPAKVFPRINGDIGVYCAYQELSIKISCRRPSSLCKPSPQTNKKACDKRIQSCGGEPNGGLKWTGRGCRGKKAQRFQDGGCQCVGFCGYQCEGKCRTDSECAWNATLSACTVKGSGVPAGPLATCSPPFAAPPPGKRSAAFSFSSN
jgi:hypothetical protein